MPIENRDNSAARPRVLAIKGESIVVSALGRVLTRNGCVLTIARDDQHAVDLCATEGFDLLILDLMAPRPADEVIGQIRRQGPRRQVPILVVSSRDHEVAVRRALSAGADAHLSIPVTFSKFLEQVRTLVSGPQRVSTSAATTSSSPKTRAASRTSENSVDFGLSGTGSSGGASFDQEAIIGKVIGAGYRLEEVLGTGGYGVVYRACQITADRRVAVKLLPRELARRNDRQRIQEEADAARRLDHPNVVRVFDVEVACDWPHIVMELLSGCPLHVELDQCGVLPPQRCAEILLPVCDAIAAAHAAGIVHRDLKPGNIFVHQSEAGETVKVLDFGTARIFEEGDLVTNTLGRITGTPEYVAPERMRDESYDGCVDMYSIGVIAYQMLTGRVPFPATDGDFLSVAMQQCEGPPPPMHELPAAAREALEPIVLDALRVEPADRCTLEEFVAGIAQGSARFCD